MGLDRAHVVVSSRSSRTASPFGVASLSHGGAHALENDDAVCEWFRYFRSAHTGHHHTRYPSSARSGLPAPELTAACGDHCQKFGDELCDAFARVWHTSFMTLSHLHASPTVGRAPPRLEIGAADVHSVWKLLNEVFLQPARQLGEAAIPRVALHQRVAPTMSATPPAR